MFDAFLDEIACYADDVDDDSLINAIFGFTDGKTRKHDKDPILSKLDTKIYIL